MMKSFFKKLAFVMAMAMVVSMAAPAAASAAEEGISLQGTKTIVTTESVEAGKTIDFSFQGAPSDWKKTYKWTSGDDAIASVDTAGLVTAHKGGVVAITITAGADKSYQHSVILTVTEPVVVPTMDAAQITEDDIYVTFAESTSIPETGEGLSVFRVFTAEEMSTMTADDKKGLAVNEAGEGYAQWYVVAADETDDTDEKEYTVSVYENFTDGATYAVVLGDDDQTWEIEGVEVRFVASVGLPTDLEVVQTEIGLAPTEVDEAIPAEVETIFKDKNGINVTNLYSQDDVEYEIVANDDLGYFSGNNEITFSEAGKMLVSATYVYYDEIKEVDVEVVSKKPGEVVCNDYADYTGAKLYQWSLLAPGEDEVDWDEPVHSLPAGDEGYQLVVILKDSRGNYLTNHEAGTATDVTGTDEEATLIDYENDEIPFVSYGFSVKFDTLDSNNLLVDEDGKVYTYTETRSYAVAYLYKDEDVKVCEMGVMPINVTEARRPDYFKVDKTSMTLLRESEAEEVDGVYIPDYYHDEYCVDDIRFRFVDNYGEYVYDTANADDYDYEFTVVPTKNAKNETVLAICDTVEAVLNGSVADFADGSVYLDFDSNDFEDVTGVSFRVTEATTGHSEVFTIAISDPKYTDDDKTTVFVDPSKALLEFNYDEHNVWADDYNRIWLKQVSKTGQEVGYFRFGTLEQNANDGSEQGDSTKGTNYHGYFIANHPYKEVATNIYSLISKEEAEDIIDGKLDVVVYEKSYDEENRKYIYTEKGLASDVYEEEGADRAAERELRKLYYKNVTRADGSDLLVNDYVLFVTDPKGNAMIATDSGIHLEGAKERVKFFAVDIAEDGFTTYAVPGTYKCNVYRVDKIDTVTGKISYKSVANNSFKVTDPIQDVKYYHQTDTKSVDSLASYSDIIDAIVATMTFKVNGQVVDWEGDDDDDNWVGTWKDKNDLNDDDGTDYYNIEIAPYTHDGKKAVKYIEKDGCVTIDTVTFRVYTDLDGGEAFYETTVKVGKSIYEAEE